MRTYLEAFRFNVLIASAYKLELIGFVLRQLIKVGFLLYFWLIISETNSQIFDLKKMLAYFLIGSGFSELTMSDAYTFGRSIQKQIRRGEFSNILIKPVKLVRFLYVSFLGTEFYTLIYSVLSICVGIFIYPPHSVLNFILFMVFVIFALIIAFSLNILIAVIGFYSPEAGSIKNVFRHITLLFSGALIPLSYFPSFWRAFAQLTPFPALIYSPVVALQEGYIPQETEKLLVLAIVWSILLWTVSSKLWQRAINQYDGVGI